MNGDFAIDAGAVRAPPGESPLTADTRELVQSLESEWRDALCAKDMGKLQSLIHPRFVLIATRGSGPFVMSRDEWLEAIQKRDVETIDLTVKDALVFKDVLVGTVEACWRVKYLGRTIDDCVLLTDVWVCDDGRWLAIRRHSTPMPTTTGE